MIDEVSLRDIPLVLDKLSETDLRVLEAQLIKLEKLKQKELCQEKFIKFVERVWPTFISGRHHKIMASAFERVERANGSSSTCRPGIPSQSSLLTCSQAGFWVNSLAKRSSRPRTLLNWQSVLVEKCEIWSILRSTTASSPS